MEKEENETVCWICKRGLIESIEEFNKIILASPYIGDEIKSEYKKGKKEFFPLVTDKFVKFLFADVDKQRYSMSGRVLQDVHIPLCPICGGLLESLIEDEEEKLNNFISKEDLENVSIQIND